MPFYLGQRYVPNANEAVALAESARIREALIGETIRLISTTFVPNEEWVFDLFEADAADAIDKAYRDGAVAYERITEAVHVT